MSFIAYLEPISKALFQNPTLMKLESGPFISENQAKKNQSKDTVHYFAMSRNLIRNLHFCTITSQLSFCQRSQKVTRKRKKKELYAIHIFQFSTVTHIFYQATQKPQELMTLQVCGTTKQTQTFSECLMIFTKFQK